MVKNNKIKIFILKLFKIFIKINLKIKFFLQFQNQKIKHFF